MLLNELWRHLEENGAPGGGDAVPAATPPSLPPGALSAEDAQAQRSALLAEQVKSATLLAIVENNLDERQRDLLTEAGLVDPAKIAAFATKLKEFAPAAAPPAPAGEGGTPLPPANGAAAVTPEEQAAQQRFHAQLRSNTLRKTALDQTDLEIGFEREWRNGWNRHMDDRKRGYSSRPVSAGDAPAVVQ